LHAYFVAGTKAVTVSERFARKLGPMAVLTGRLRVQVASWSLAGLAGLALVAALVLLGLNGSVMGAGRIGVYAVLALAVGL